MKRTTVKVPYDVDRAMRDEANHLPHFTLLP